MSRDFTDLSLMLLQTSFQTQLLVDSSYLSHELLPGLIELLIIEAHSFLLFWVVRVVSRESIGTCFISKWVHIISQNALKSLVSSQDFLLYFLRINLSVV